MKKRFFFLVVGLIFALLLAACSSGSEEATTTNDADETPETKEVTDNGGESGSSDASSPNEDVPTYTVATDNAYVPFEFLDEASGEMIGFDIDLINAIAEEVGFNVDLEVMEFDGVVAGIASGRFDIAIAGMTITEERKKSIDFSIPYYDAGLILAVRDDNDEIQSIEDTDGKVIATRSGTTSETYVVENTNATAEVFPQITEAYQNVIAGRADAVLYDIPNVLYYTEKEAGGQLKVVGDLLTGEQYGIAFPKGSELRDQVDAALEKLMENGTYGDIYETWFGQRPEGM